MLQFDRRIGKQRWKRKLLPITSYDTAILHAICRSGPLSLSLCNTGINGIGQLATRKLFIYKQQTHQSQTYTNLLSINHPAGKTIPIHQAIVTAWSITWMMSKSEGPVLEISGCFLGSHFYHPPLMLIFRPHRASHAGSGLWGSRHRADEGFTLAMDFRWF